MTDVRISSVEDKDQQTYADAVIIDAREILEAWRCAQKYEWTRELADSMHAAILRLRIHAERANQQPHFELANRLLECFQLIREQRSRLSSEIIEILTALMHELTQTGFRKNDQPASGSVILQLRQPLFIALADIEQAHYLKKRLGFFGMQAEVFTDALELRHEILVQQPMACILDLDFTGKAQGLELAFTIQNGREKKLPILFFSQHEADTLTRLSVVRAGGEHLFIGELEPSGLLEVLEAFSCTRHFEPFRVLVVDDSRAQSVFTERTLNAAAIITRSVNDPTKALAEITEFSPDLIILDMYMPECSGPELAKVIRQSERFDSVPIIYLSGEEDLVKQLTAMSEGADDFLTKPVMPHHLIATVRNRAIRARNLKAHIVCDSLTGLYNHTHILHLLEDASLRAQRNNQPLSFVMLDIDHFKKVNDTYGHIMGDRVIKSLAIFLKQRLRKSDFIGRYGGEEFALVLPNTDIETARKVVDSIRERFERIAYPAQPQDLTCTFSAGIAQFESGMELMELVDRADSVLYTAKKQGRNQVAVYT